MERLPLPESGVGMQAGGRSDSRAAMQAGSRRRGHKLKQLKRLPPAPPVTTELETGLGAEAALLRQRSSPERLSEEHAGNAQLLPEHSTEPQLRSTYGNLPGSVQDSEDSGGGTAPSKHKVRAAQGEQKSAKSPKCALAPGSSQAAPGASGADAAAYFRREDKEKGLPGDEEMQFVRDCIDGKADRKEGHSGASSSSTLILSSGTLHFNTRRRGHIAENRSKYLIVPVGSGFTNVHLLAKKLRFFLEQGWQLSKPDVIITVC
jgi:hypothetical protein